MNQVDQPRLTGVEDGEPVQHTEVGAPRLARDAKRFGGPGFIKTESGWMARRGPWMLLVADKARNYNLAFGNERLNATVLEDATLAEIMSFIGYIGKAGTLHAKKTLLPIVLGVVSKNEEKKVFSPRQTLLLQGLASKLEDGLAANLATIERNFI